MQPASTWGGNYSRFTFDEVKRYFYMLKEQGVPVLDDDFNLSQEIALTLMRRLVTDALGDGSVGDAFKIVGTGASNDFTVTGGDGTADGAAHFYLGGYMVVLTGNTTYAGQELAPPALTTPSAARVDEVYLDIYMDEVDPVDDPAIVDPVFGFETSRRLKLYYQVLVAEGSAVPTAYTDAQGRYHFTAHLSTINRTATAVIDAGMVVDARRNVLLARNDDFNAHTADGGAHGATSSSVSGTIVRRDAAGNFRTNAPQHDNDVPRKIDITNAIAALLDSAPGTLDTLNELAAALGDDPNFAATTAASIAALQTAVNNATFPSGFIMLAAQSTAPTGWTKLVDHNNKALRVVSGTAGSGGTVAFSTAFASGRAVSSVVAGGTVSGASLSIAQLASHSHTMGFSRNMNTIVGQGYQINDWPWQNGSTWSYETGTKGLNDQHAHGFTGLAHSHTLDMAVQYVDVIRIQKN